MSTNTPEAGVGPDKGPSPDRAGGFSLDVEERSIPEAITGWVRKLRSGDPGALPSVLGLVVLALIFMQVSDRFLSKYNIGNLPGQGLYIAIIALGLVFVLLLGEIDLSAGTAGGTCAALAAQAVFSGNLHQALPDGPLLGSGGRPRDRHRDGDLAEGLVRCGRGGGGSLPGCHQPHATPVPGPGRRRLHRRCHRRPERLPGGQGRHPQARGHAGAVPGLAGRAPVRPERSADQHLELRAVARHRLRQPQPRLELGLHDHCRGRLSRLHDREVGDSEASRPRARLAQPGPAAWRCAGGRGPRAHRAGEREPQHQPLQGHRRHPVGGGHRDHPDDPVHDRAQQDDLGPPPVCRRRQRGGGASRRHRRRPHQGHRVHPVLVVRCPRWHRPGVLPVVGIA